MPDERTYADRKFAAGLGRRAQLGCCADCGRTLDDIAALVCGGCRPAALAKDPERFPARELGHRNQVMYQISKGKLSG